MSPNLILRPLATISLVAIMALAGCSSGDSQPDANPDAATDAAASGDAPPSDAPPGDAAAASPDAPPTDQAATPPADAAAGGAAASAGGADTGKSLYDRVGGKDILTQLASKLVDAIAASPTITKNEKVAARFKSADVAKIKAGIADMLCQVSGGPCKYSGRSMKDAHAGLGITAEEWKAMGGLFIRSARELNIPKRERMELANLVSMTKPDIVGK